MSQPSKPLVTQKDVARALGLSQASVSKALKNNPRLDEATRRRVHAMAKKLGYQPNSMAAGLAHFKQTSRIKPVQAAIAWLNTWRKPQELRSYPQFESYWQGVLMTAEKFGYRLEQFMVNDEISPARLEKILLTRSIRGMLIPPIPHGVNIEWSGFNWTSFSCVRLSRGTRGVPDFHVVTSAQSANAAMAVRAMSEKGYRRIGFAGYKSSRATYLGGFLHEQAITIPPPDHVPAMLLEEDVLIEELQNNVSGSKHAARLLKWLDQWKIEAILTEVPITNLLKFAGRRVPQDIAVAAVNVTDLPFDAGIDQNPREIGRVAALVVISLINDNDCGIPAIHREILVKGKWVDGTSLPSRV